MPLSGAGPANQALDVSFNSLGGLCGDQCVDALGGFLKSNRSLTHLDISHNHIDSASQLATLQASLESNHTLLGLHVAGNAWAVWARCPPSPSARLVCTRAC